jgi:hypothetical protein
MMPCYWLRPDAGALRFGAGLGVARGVAFFAAAF